MKNLNRKEFEKMLKVCLNYIEDHPKNWNHTFSDNICDEYIMDHKQDFATIKFINHHKLFVELYYKNTSAEIHWILDLKDEKIQRILKDISKINHGEVSIDDSNYAPGISSSVKDSEVAPKIEPKKEIPAEKQYEVTFKNQVEVVFESDLTRPMPGGFASIFRNLQVGEEMYDISSNTNYKRIK